MSEPYYSDDLVTLYYGDCVSVMESIGDQSVDTVLTDPPYSSGGRRENSRSLRKSMTRGTSDDEWIRGDAMSTNGFMHLIRLCGIEWRRILKPGGHALAFIDWRMAATLPRHWKLPTCGNTRSWYGTSRGSAWARYSVINTSSSCT